MTDEVEPIASAWIEGDFGGAFLHLSGGTTVGVRSSLSNIHMQGAGGYTPPLFCRPRLARFAPYVHRALAIKGFLDYLVRRGS